MSSSHTGLHARKKVNVEDGEHHPTSPESGGLMRVKKNKIYPLAFLGSDIGCAFEAVLGFLVCGLLLAYFFYHHQHRKVVLQVMNNPMAHAGAALRGRVGFRHHFFTGNPRTVTVVLPSVVNPNGRRQRLDSIFETWGPSARAVYVVHNVSEFPQGHHSVLGTDSQPEDPYSYPQLLLVPQEITSEDGLPRLNYVIRSVHEKIDPDFAFFVNDHTFVIPEHLCKYVEERKPEEDMYDGHAMKNSDDVFNSGAAGYLLSRETMKKLVQKWDEENETCLVKNGAKWLQGNPGLVTTQCLQKELGISAVDTRHKGKWHRFHAFPITRMVSGDVDEWYKKKHEGMNSLMNTDESYNTLLSGDDCCAADTISFHYVEYKESRALFATREALLKNPHMSDHEVKKLMIAEWPRDHREVGGYSRGLPKESNEAGWKDLIHVIRKLSSRHTQREC
eukprot:Nitzschia sp. Nitz4//scaffold289_size23394//7016//8511//NITZ4_008475-RA/size23394-augustus-gene-0.39-mRNA-1//1//CDS//3329545816//1553//frame0